MDEGGPEIRLDLDPRGLTEDLLPVGARDVALHVDCLVLAGGVHGSPGF
jgi:hypothetical protein